MLTAFSARHLCPENFRALETVLESRTAQPRKTFAEPKKICLSRFKLAVCALDPLDNYSGVRLFTKEGGVGSNVEMRRA